MKRIDYLSQPEVTGFVHWAGHLVRGEWRLEHSWRGKGPAFHCGTLYEAFSLYLWPNSDSGGGFAETVREFDRFRVAFTEICTICTRDDQRKVVAVSRDIVDWGSIRNLKALDDWELMRPDELQSYIDTTKRILDPVTGDTDKLDSIRYMGAGFSKIYAALIPGLPIYDSRVACALACLVRLYCRDNGLSRVPPLLNLGIPSGQGNKNGRCKATLHYSQRGRKLYAKSNLQFAWLMQGMTSDPGEFAQVPAGQRVDALQSALFMLGYARLRDDAVVKGR